MDVSMTRNTAKQPRVGDLPEPLIKLFVQNRVRGNEAWTNEKEQRTLLLRKWKDRMEAANKKNAVPFVPVVWYSPEDPDWLDKLKEFFSDENYVHPTLKEREPLPKYESKHHYMYTVFMEEALLNNPELTRGQASDIGHEKAFVYYNAEHKWLMYEHWDVTDIREKGRNYV